VQPCDDEEPLEERCPALEDRKKDTLMRLEEPIFTLMHFIYPFSHLDIAWVVHEDHSRRYDSHDEIALLFTNYIWDLAHVRG